jgi:anti-anti-sigma factor
MPIMKVEGAIGHDNLPSFVHALSGLAGTDARRIVLDFAQLTYIDSAGLCAIYDFVDNFDHAGEVEIRGLSPQLRRVFYLSGLTKREGVRVVPEAGLPAPLERSETGPREHRAVPAPGSWKRTYPSELGQLEKIREFSELVGQHLSLTEERIYGLKVAVSEAAANAIEHGGPEGTLSIEARVSPTRLTVVVSHPGSFKPRAGNEPARGHRGMGLPLMCALVDEVTVTNTRGRGTRVALSLQLNQEAEGSPEPSQET